MTSRIKTLVLAANGFGWKVILSDTVVRGLFGIRGDLSHFPAWVQGIPLAQKVFGLHYDALSYTLDWEEAFCADPDLQVDLVNINDLVAYRSALRRISEYDLVVILHSATGDSMRLLLSCIRQLQKRRCILGVFIGNEYDIMGQKFRFLRESGAEYVFSQMPPDITTLLYSDCPGVKAFSLPHGLNPRLYSPPPEDAPRPVDLGYKGYIYPIFIGDDERMQLIRFFEMQGSRLGLCMDISYEKVNRAQWASFLRSCKGIISSESGSYYLDPTGDIINNARRYLKEHPSASLDELKQVCFTDVPFHFSGKCISSRHFEPIGTKTCQVLLEGRYNDILQPDVHYISIRRDYSNIEDAIHRLKDEDYRRQMVDRTWEYVMAEHTYAHRVRQFLRIVGVI